MCLGTARLAGTLEGVLQHVPGEHGALDADRVLHDALECHEVAERLLVGSTSPAIMPRNPAASALASATLDPVTDSVIIDALDWLIEQPAPWNVTSATRSPST